MASEFTYSISADIPGGVFTAAASDRLASLITAGIATALQEISTTGNDLTIRFVTDITADEKTALDGNTTGPAGGFVGRSADYIELTANAQVLADLDVLQVTANGILSATIYGQLKRGDDVSINGFGEEVRIRSNGIAPFNKTTTNLDGSGAFSYICGPSFNRGDVTFTIETTNLATREIIVSFN